jgi:glycosyltransferase 2 family protein
MKAGLKAGLRWVILGATLFFVAQVLKDNWQQVWAIRVSPAGWASLAIALGITLLAHLSAGWVWSQVLRDLGQPVPRTALVQAYLKTTIAKYLPGNVWHYYGRIKAATAAGATIGAATLSVVLEPLLMAAAALLLLVLCSQQIGSRYGLPILALQWGCLAGILGSVHPRVLNPLLGIVGKLKRSEASSAVRVSSDTSEEGRLEHYPLVPFLGELGFVLLRGGGFLFTFLAVSPIAPETLPLLLGAFSLAWLLGLVVPGAPGGVGVFEATAIGLLNQTYPAAVIVSVVALYRLVSVLAEAIGAGLSWLDQQR